MDAREHSAGGVKITGSGMVRRAQLTVQTIPDQLMPDLVPLLLTFACMWLLRKKVNALWIIVGFFVIGIVGYASRPAGPVINPVVRRGLPPAFYWRMDDNHGSGVNSVYCCSAGVCHL